MKVALEIGYWAVEGRTHGNLGIVYKLLSDYRKAIGYHEKHLKSAIEIHDRGGEV